MNYELAKELKDAGFPAHTYVPAGDYDLCWICGEEQDACILTLTELIEACGVKGFSLVQYDNGEWSAYPTNRAVIGDGSTPEEAVARLWLALNKGKSKTEGV